MPKGGFWTAQGAGSYFEPKMPWRFKVHIEGFQLEDNPDGDDYHDHPDDEALVWYAKTIEKPSISIGIRAGDQVDINNPGIPIMALNSVPKMNKAITMTLIDPSYPNATRKLLRLFRRAGYNDDKAQGVNTAKGSKTAEDGIKPNAGEFSPNVLKSSTGQVRIQQLDAFGIPLETWELWEAFPAEINFGKLDYSSDSPVEISITWGFSTFFATMHGDKGLGPTHAGNAMQEAEYGKEAADQMKERGFTYYKDHAPSTLDATEKTILARADGGSS